ncbi:MAG: glycosyltransferase [Xenococcaceae cyanobacterium MO_188.B32]|nr:glycosyltransferase [Xenococcaceae cyanobacterium MO_188.B32]
MQPKVSVVMSVHNGSLYLHESVDSILNQIFTDFEFIIVDDGSTDDSWGILTKYAKCDRRIKLYKNEENIGLTKSLNKGLKLAEGEYIARQDADDISLPTRFEKQVIFLQEHPEIILASCDIELINVEGLTIDKYQRHCEPDLVAWYLLFYNRLGGHSQVMFRREITINLGGYLENCRYSQDYELWCRLIKVGKIAILPETLMKQRRHSESISAGKSSEQKVYSLEQVKANIKQLLGEEINIEEAEDLSRFWIGHWWPRHFPDSRKVGSLHFILKKIYQAFIQQNTYSNSFDPELSRKIHKLIGKQFLYWIQAPIGRRHGLIDKILISRYVLVWHPLGLPSSWLIGLFWKSPIYALRAFIRRLHHPKISNIRL